VSEKSTENSQEKQRHSLLHSIETKRSNPAGETRKFDFNSLQKLEKRGTVDNVKGNSFESKVKKL